MSTGRSLLFFGIPVVLGLALLGMAFFLVQESIHDQQRRYMQSVVRATAASIDNFIEGYLSSAEMVARLPHFRMKAHELQNGGMAGPILDYLRTMTGAKELPAIADAFVIDHDNTMLAGTAFPTDYVPVAGHEIRPDAGKLGIYKNHGGELFLGFSTRVSDGLYLFLLVDSDMMYKSTASFVMLGEKGYVMFKHSSGLVLTHPVAEQVGSDVIRGRRERFPDLDYTDIEKLVEEQKSRKEGIRVYYSYWWDNAVPRPARKMSAYLSVPIQNDFIIVSAVNDYAEQREPILYNSAFNIAAAILITLGVVGMLFSRHRENQRQIQRENEYLKELNRRQEETQHNQRLQMIGTLAGGIAHEFRNLLTPIMGYSGMMRESLPPDSPLREDLDEIYSCSVRAKEIIQQITSISRKKLEPTLEPINLGEVITAALKVASTFKPPDVTLRSEVNFGGRLIMGNKNQLNQIILNLCNNAFQAMPGGGGLHVTGKCVKERGGAGRAVLTIHDDGMGIKEEHLERIFDPFFTTKRTGEGTGLGLSVVQNIVELHGGAVSVTSSPGEGSTFSLSFPLVSTDVSKRRISMRKSSSPASELISIVLVEGDDAIMNLLHRGLASGGFTTQAFSNPALALAEITRNPCRLLITDYDMSGMTGIELALKVREARPEVKILLLTSLADAEVGRFVERGVIDSYQIKPVPVSELLERVSAMFV